MPPMRRVLYFIVAFLLAVEPNAAQAADPNPDGTSAAAKAAATFRIPQGFTVEVFAAEPSLENPVAICLDEQGRVFVAEEHRFNQGTEENRTRPYLLEDDLQIKTLEDRMAMFKKWEQKFEGGLSFLTKTSDIVRRLEDRDGDGQADMSTIFAAGFNSPLDGLGAGLIARDGKVWYTCIPNLWLLEDQNSDGKADARTVLLRGFGVNAAFLGHDLHGLVWGPDGKLYFSVGDRGAHVITKEGTTISNPRNGAVYRCQPDGTELEMIHRGLRNPQELAFDQFGNLFADDNNCDKGDHSRLVYVVPGGESGWNMAYQTIPEPYLTGPWHAEGIWHLAHELQPAYIVPPVGKLGAGPSGFVFSSGTSLPARFSNHFFYCNFTGNGGVESFAVQEVGAGFAIVDHRDFCKPVQASDVDFGYDGKMYVADYPVSPWDRSTSGGRVYTIFDKSRLEQPVVQETRTLFQNGFDGLTSAQLAALLHHDDMRVRLRAQFELAARGAAATNLLAALAKQDDNQLTRLHAIWGLGQIGRNHPAALQVVMGLLDDNDSEVRGQAVRVLGDARCVPAADVILPLLADEAARVRFFAALALGSMKYQPAIAPIFEMVRANNGQDRFLSHAGVAALEQIGDRQQVQQRAGDESMAVRMTVLLVQRRWSDARISQFLDDAELKIVTEAARVINDAPLPVGREKLANLAERYRNVGGDQIAPLMRRIINANFQIGQRGNVEAVIGIATSTAQSSAIRAEAISALSAWQGPSKRDRVTGFWQPVAERNPATVRDVVQHAASNLLAATTAQLQTQVTELLVALKVETDDREFAAWVADENRSEGARLAALRLLANRKYDDLATIIEQTLVSSNSALRAEARDLLATTDQNRASALFSHLLEDPDAAVGEQQRALAMLSKMNSPLAAQTLDLWANLLRQRKVPPALQLDVIDALRAAPTAERTAAVRAFEAVDDPADVLAKYRGALDGGDARIGRELFVGHAAAQCIRCHLVAGRGGTAGPDLSQVASREREIDRRFLLESIVAPNEKIAKGFAAVTLVLNTGKIVAGTIKAEDELSLTLITPQNETIRVLRDAIDERTAATSAMPAMTKVLSLREIRDLVEYLSTLK